MKNTKFIKIFFSSFLLLLVVESCRLVKITLDVEFESQDSFYLKYEITNRSSDTLYFDISNYSEDLWCEYYNEDSSHYFSPCPYNHSENYTFDERVKIRKSENCKTRKKVFTIDDLYQYSYKRKLHDSIFKSRFIVKIPPGGVYVDYVSSFGYYPFGLSDSLIEKYWETGLIQTTDSLIKLHDLYKLEYSGDTVYYGDMDKYRWSYWDYCNESKLTFRMIYDNRKNKEKMDEKIWRGRLKSNTVKVKTIR